MHKAYGFAAGWNALVFDQQLLPPTGNLLLTLLLIPLLTHWPYERLALRLPRESDVS